MNTASFDPIAQAYYSSAPPVPQEYINLLQETFQIQPKDHIIDLGCGSGDLALEFAKTSSFVVGIDASEKMIAMAKKKDLQKQVTWEHTSVEEFNFVEEKYNLIFSYESFHLFPNHKELIQKCAKALQPKGILGVGWVIYEWDIPLKDAITETFAKHNISRGEWGLWMCPNFQEVVVASKAKLTVPQKKEIVIRTKTPISSIVNSILSNSKSASLHSDLKLILAQDLTKCFLEIYPSGESEGYTTYALMYSRKNV